jgi:peroxiredoxin
MRLAQLAQLGFSALAAWAVYAFVTAAKDGEIRRACAPLCLMEPDYAGQNRLAPDFALPNLEGNTVRLSDYRGKVVLLNFWTKDCRPCLEEMPSLAELAQTLRTERGIELLTVSTDSSADARDALRSVFGGHAVPFPVLIDSERAVVKGKFGTELYPETWFIDPKGVLRARFDGGRDWSSIFAVELARALGRPSACQIEFSRRAPAGPHAGTCEEFGLARR